MTKRKIFMIPLITTGIVLIGIQSTVVSKHSFIAFNQGDKTIKEETKPNVEVSPSQTYSYGTYPSLPFESFFANKSHNAMILNQGFNYDVIGQSRMARQKDFIALSEDKSRQQKFDFTFQLLKNYPGIFADSKTKNPKYIIVPFENFYKKMSASDNYFMWIQSFVIFWDYMMNYLLEDVHKINNLRSFNVNAENVKSFWTKTFKKEVNRHINLGDNLHWVIPPKDLSLDDLQQIWTNTNYYFYNNYKS